MIIRSTQTYRKPTTPKQTCDHDHDHTHSVKNGGLFVPEALVDTPHAALEIYSHQGGHEGVVGAASAGISVLAGMRAVQNFRSGGLEHNIEGAGNLALSAAGGLVAFETFFGSEHGHEAHGHGHGHGHGFGAVGVLEVLHGAAELTVGALEIKRPQRRKIGMLRMAKGAAVIGSQIVPGVAPVMHAFHLGASVTLAAMDPRH